MHTGWEVAFSPEDVLMSMRYSKVGNNFVFSVKDQR